MDQCGSQGGAKAALVEDGDLWRVLLTKGGGRTSMRRPPSRPAGVRATRRVQTLTPKSEAMPARPEAYPWPTARNFHSPLCRYSSPKTIAVSVEASSERS